MAYGLGGAMLVQEQPQVSLVGQGSFGSGSLAPGWGAGPEQGSPPAATAGELACWPFGFSPA